MTITHYAYNRDGSLIESLTAGVSEYQHEHIEGAYIASFSLVSGDGSIDDDRLRHWFDTRLMTEISTVFDGREVWRGFVWEMQLELNGELGVKSMENVANATKTRYTNTSGNIVHTGWKLHPTSIETYGRKERILSVSSESLEEADERANVELQYSASPYNTAIAEIDSEDNVLRVTLVGRSIAANNIILIADSELRDIADDDEVIDSTDPRYAISLLGYGDGTDVGTMIRRAVEVAYYNSGLLYALDIADNDTVTLAGVSSNIGVYDRLVELAKLRDSDGNFYRLRIRNDGGVIYEQFNEHVDYLRYPAPRGLELPNGDKPTWEAKPGIQKRVDASVGIPLPDTWLSDKRLTFYERAVMRDGDKMASLHARSYDAADTIRAIEANRRWIEAAKRKR